MGATLQQNQTSIPLEFKMVQSGDHVTAATGKSPTVVLSKNGGSFGAPAGAVTEMAHGWYKVAANATDANTLGTLKLYATASGADDADEEFQVVGFDPEAAYASPGDEMTLESGERDSIAATLLDLSAGIEVGLTLRQAMRLIAAAVAGKLSGASTTTITIRNAVADSKNRIVAQVDSAGDRSSVNYDLS